MAVRKWLTRRIRLETYESEDKELEIRNRVDLGDRVEYVRGLGKEKGSIGIVRPLSE